MRKLLFMIVLIAVTTGSSFADTIVFRMKYKGRNFEKVNGGNQKVRNVGQIYMVFDYNGSTYEYSDVHMIKFWKEKGNKLQRTTQFTGTMDAKLVNKSRRTFMTLATDKDDVKESMVLIEPNKMMLRRGITERYVIPFSLEGTSIVEKTDANGKRIYETTYLKGKFNKRWSMGLAGVDNDNADSEEDEGTFNTKTVAETVAEIQQKLIDLGYQKEVPDSTGDDDDNDS